MAKKRKDGLKCRTFTYEGKRYFVYGKTNKELTEKELQKRRELEAGTEQRTNPTLNEYYSHFTEARRGSVKESTIRGQKFQFEAAAAVAMDGNEKKFGKLHIRDITSRDLQHVQLALAKSGRTTETVNNIMNHVKHVFNAAVKDDTVEKNPCKCIQNLKRTEKPARETIHRALSHEETAAFFQAANDRNSYYCNLFSFMIQTGVRVGEAGALTMFDIDEKGGYIHVRRTITRSEIGSYKLGEDAKTRSGVRDIPLTDGALKAVREQKRLNFMLFGGNLPETLFASLEGKLLRDYAVDREIARICEVANIERFTSHAFRATFATRFIEQRPEDFKVLSEILGHSDISITLNLYTHVMDEKKREAMNSIEIKLG